MVSRGEAIRSEVRIELTLESDIGEGRESDLHSCFRPCTGVRPNTRLTRNTGLA